MKILAALFLLLSCVHFTACGDEEVVSIEDYIAEKNLTTQVTSRGLHYIIENPGTPPNPTVANTITIKYRGYLLNGKEFDSGNAVTFPLSNLILGWQLGIPLIGTGGKITLIIPAELAYGNRGSGSIPPNAPIAFDIDLLSFR